MAKATIDELRANLTVYLDRVKAGEDVLVVEGQTLVARISSAGIEGEQERLQRLEREGRIRLGTGTVSEAFWNAPQGRDPQGLGLKALLEEREEGR